MRKAKLINFLQYILLGLVISIVFAKVVSFDIVQFDDERLLYKPYGFIRNLNNAPNAFIQGANVTSGTFSNYYRPLHVASFIINAQWCKQRPGCYHLSNLVLHVLFVVTVFIFLQKLGIQRWISFFLALLFSVHPLVVSVVAWIPGTNEQLPYVCRKRISTW